MPAIRIRVFLVAFAFSPLIPLSLMGGSVPKQDSVWKRYLNTEWGYCVSYPARWHRGDAFEGSGIFVETGVKRGSSPVGEIDVAALHPETAGPQLSLVDDLQVHLEGLRKFERAQHLEVLEQRPIDVAGLSALFTKERYYDPLERAQWMNEIVFMRRDGVLYRLELACRADQLSRFEPAFARFLGTFQFQCQPPR